MSFIKIEQNEPSKHDYNVVHIHRHQSSTSFQNKKEQMFGEPPVDQQVMQQWSQQMRSKSWKMAISPAASMTQCNQRLKSQLLQNKVGGGKTSSWKV